MEGADEWVFVSATMSDDYNKSDDYSVSTTAITSYFKNAIFRRPF